MLFANYFMTLRKNPAQVTRGLDCDKRIDRWTLVNEAVFILGIEPVKGRFISVYGKIAGFSGPFFSHGEEKHVKNPN